MTFFSPWTTWRDVWRARKSKGVPFMERILSPLFDRRVFLVACLCVSAAGVWLLRRGARPPERPGPSALVREPRTAYQRGFDDGFDAFLMQTNQYTPRPFVAKYSTSEEGDSDEEEVERGYVDGYHKATELQHCPRCNYGY